MKRSIPSRIKELIRSVVPVGRLSYSQEGEDLVLSRLFDGRGKRPGFFVDVGAHHPTRFSNTYFFYRRGWSGINIDPLPGTIRIFSRMRPRDITVECGVSSVSGLLNYHMFNEPALNTFSSEEAKKKVGGSYHLKEVRSIPVRPLSEILDENLKNGVEIDFMTIDAEDLDYDVVVSNNWLRYRPTFVLVECLETRLLEVGSHKTAEFLRSVGYVPWAKTVNTVFFKNEEGTSR